MPSLFRQQDATVAKYLSLYSETESQQLHHFPRGFSQALVIPVYREEFSILERYKTLAAHNPNTLLILVINRPEDDNDQRWCLPFFSGLGQILWQSVEQTLSLFSLESGSALLVVDRCLKGKALPKDQGVGLARKIGADILCTLISNNCVRSPWIFNTDADAYLPLDYFSVTQDVGINTAAIIYPFEHFFVDPLIAPLPTRLYEFSLHYYVEGLRQANSPYAYHTLGSTIAVNYLHYAKVRGFPRRAAAEDFYLLNKLAKTGPIVSLEKPLIQLAARESTRVPFGTGPAVISLASEPDPMAMSLYHPDSFCYLYVFLQTLDTLSEQGTSTHLEKIIHNKINQHTNTQLDARYLLSLVEAFNVPAALAHSFRHGKKKSTRIQHLHHWFDAFKTLKFIHYLRDHYLGTISFQQWMASKHQNNNHLLSTIAKRIQVTETSQDLFSQS